MDKLTLQNKFPTINSLISEIDKYTNKTFQEIDINNRLSNPKNKGRLGNIIEEGIFGYPINSDPSSDFDYLGVELKTTGLRKTKNGFTAKERLTLCALNYFDVLKETFEESHVYNKNKELFIVLYEYINDLPYSRFPILKGLDFKIPLEDLKIIKEDYNKIRNLIQSGNAHLLTESITNYLCACTAGSGHGKTVPQPNNTLFQAKVRKFAFKRSYLDEIIKKNHGEDLQKIFNKSELDLSKNGFEDTILRKLNKFKGKSIKQICAELNIKFNESKLDMYSYAISKIFNVSNINKTSEFTKANICSKTIRVQTSGCIKESISFPYFSFMEIANTTWETSQLYNIIETTKFLFNIFQQTSKDGNYIYQGSFFYTFPIIEANIEGEKVFKKTKEILLSGSIVKEIKKLKNNKTKLLTNFPHPKDSKMFHVRPHGKNSFDSSPLPIKDKLTNEQHFTKQCFWINSSYLKQIVNIFLMKNN